ncbi:MAG: hypothetical protein ACLFWM_09970 [Actinomycetota bacterium]
MIDTVVVAADTGMREGIRRLLEADGDIRVLEERSHLPRGAEPLPPGSVMVVGPRLSNAVIDWWDGTGEHTGAVIVLVPLPGWRHFPYPVTQIPMELRGVLLRRAVRRSAALAADPGHRPAVAG